MSVAVPLAPQASLGNTLNSPAPSGIVPPVPSPVAQPVVRSAGVVEVPLVQNPAYASILTGGASNPSSISRIPPTERTVSMQTFFPGAVGDLHTAIVDDQGREAMQGTRIYCVYDLVMNICKVKPARATGIWLYDISNAIKQKIGNTALYPGALFMNFPFHRNPIAGVSLVSMKLLISSIMHREAQRFSAMYREILAVEEVAEMVVSQEAPVVEQAQAVVDAEDPPVVEQVEGLVPPQDTVIAPVPPSQPENTGSAGVQEGASSQVGSMYPAVLSLPPPQMTIPPKERTLSAHTQHLEVQGYIPAPFGDVNMEVQPEVPAPPGDTSMRDPVEAMVTVEDVNMEIPAPNPTYDTESDNDQEPPSINREPSGIVPDTASVIPVGEAGVSEEIQADVEEVDGAVLMDKITFGNISSRFIRLTPLINNKRYMSVRDYIMVMCDKDNDSAGLVWRRLNDKRKSELESM